jgi:hypothetical protein
MVLPGENTEVEEQTNLSGEDNTIIETTEQRFCNDALSVIVFD